MKKLIGLLLIVIIIFNLIGCSRLEIRDDLKKDLLSQLELLKESRKYSEVVGLEGFKEMLGKLEQYSNLSKDEELGIEKMRDLTKKYMLWEVYTYVTPNQSKARESLDEFDRLISEIEKYIE